jgi:DNA-binding CsgD family transcriptional regulator
MATLAGRIAEQGLKLLNEIAAEAWSLESFASSGLDRLPRLVASEVTTLSICDLARGRRTVFSTPNRAFSAGERASFDAHFHEHPLVLYHSKTPGGTTHRISDSLTNSQFRRTPLYADYYRCVGIDHVMALPLYVDRRFLVSFVFNRKRRDFDEAERDALDLLRPQLAALFGQALSQERTRSLLTQLDSLATPDGWSAIELDGERRLVRASEATRERIKACWPHWKGAEGTRLPEVVDRWMQERLEAAENLAGTAASGSLTVGRSGRALRVRLVPNPASGGGFLLFVSLAVEADFPASAAGATLTPREREVLQWAAAGKTNVEIGAILDTSPRTVEKHFEHVFEKLGVETRMAAVMRLLAGSPQR